MKQDFYLLKNKLTEIISDPFPNHDSKAELYDKMLSPYPFIAEMGKRKFTKINLESFIHHRNNGIEIHYIHKGRYEWFVEGKTYTLFPGDLIVTNPWECHGSRSRFVDLGVFSWLILVPEQFSQEENLLLGKWSGIPLSEQIMMGEILKRKNVHVFRNHRMLNCLSSLYNEVTLPTVGSSTMVSNLVDEIFILLAREFSGEFIPKIETTERNFDAARLESLLSKNLAYPWSIEEMAQHMNFGITSFIEHCKKNTGLTPVNFLIGMRIAKSLELLKEKGNSITAISYDCGFSSIQHFSDTFKKRIGLSPSQYMRVISTTK